MAQNSRTIKLNVLESCIDAIEWSHRFETKIEKANDGTLGIVVNTYPFSGTKETCTAITSIRSQCNLNNIALLDIGFRIVAVDGHDISRLKFNDVVKVIKGCKDKRNAVKFKLQRPLNLVKIISERFNQSPESSPKDRIPLTPPIYNNNNIANGESIKLDNLDNNKKGGRQSGGDQNTATVQLRLPSYTTQLSAGSELTPVESPEAAIDFSDENTPLMADFSDAAVSQDNTDPEVVSAVLENPWNTRIIWKDTTKVVLLKSKKDEKVGFHYKIKCRKEENDRHYLVDKVEPNTPAYGKLYVGDWIRSVNGTPILDDKELLRREIENSKKEVCLMIQRPGEIKKGKQTTAKSTKQDPKCNGQRKEPIISIPSISLTETVNLSDIKIDGISVYNQQISIESTNNAIVPKDSLFNHSLVTFLGGSKMNKDTNGACNSTTHVDKTALLPMHSAKCTNGHVGDHRRNHSDSSCLCLQDTDPSSLTTRHTSYNSDCFNSLQDICTKLKQTVKTDLDGLPYMRINLVSTNECVQSYPNTIIKKLLNALGVKADEHLSSKHLFEVESDSVKSYDSSYNNNLHTIEDLLLAKDLAVQLRADVARGENVDERLSILRQSLRSSDESVHGIPLNFIEQILDIDQHKKFLEVEIENFSFVDIISLWPTVYFTKNSIFMIVFDLKMLINDPSREIDRILTCINLIRSSSSNTAIYLISEKTKEIKLEQAMVALSPLEEVIKHSGLNGGACLSCTCDISLVPEKLCHQIQKNESSNHMYFLIDKERDWLELVSNIKGQMYSRNFVDSKYPKVALLAQKMLKKEDRTFTTTKNFFKQKILCQILNDSSVSDSLLQKTLTAMHNCGKILYQAQVAHRTTHNNTLTMFICHKPGAIKTCYEQILEHQRKLWGGTGSLTATNFPKTMLQKADLQKILASDENSELLAFLELYHIIEPADDQNQFYFTPSFFKPMDSGGMGQLMANGHHRTLYIDFHGFLPFNMCLSILSKLEEQVDDHVQIYDMLTASYDHHQVKFDVCLDPLGGIAKIIVSLKPSQSGEKFYSFIKNAFSKAVITNLLTYHIGPECRDHNMPPQSPIQLHTGIVNVIDIEQQASPVHSIVQELDFWRPTQMPVQYGQLGPRTHIMKVPEELLHIICNNLNIGDGWKKLSELLFINDNRKVRRYSQSTNPCLQLLEEYVKNDNVSSDRQTLQYIIQLVCLDPNGLQRQDILSDINQVLEYNGVTNWMLNTGLHM